MKLNTSLPVSDLATFMTMIAPRNTFGDPDDKSDFVPVVRFLVMSDSHIETFADVGCSRIQKAISLGYSDAQSDSVYKSLDAVMFCGDITDKGDMSQYIAFKSTVDSALKEETKLLAILASNHDCWGSMGRGALSYFSSLTGLHTDWHDVINGYHFIGISASADSDYRYDPEQISWVKEQLDKAVADDPEKPIFVTHHEHVLDTVYGSGDKEWGIDHLKSVFEEYPQIIHFSGHSHYPLNDPRSIWQGSFTAVGTGAIKYMEFTVDGKKGVHPDHYEKTGQTWIVEVSAQNEVRLRGYDVYSEVQLCEYVIKEPANAANRQFTPDKQEAASSAPVFPDLGSRRYITVPAAKSTDGDIIFLYRAIVFDENGNEIDHVYQVNNYWTYPTYDSVTLAVNAPRGCTVKVFAENAYGMRSEPLTFEAG
ncbi:metallophosphoesterase family protein [Cohnella zeiphila]|uniref:Metallophosphoesterase n=1 Tax=Cohnella zeiphila TaxID=2761120 RepID=A0A7X0SSW2_9BACL|nr:metallophosphoesterase [Cohnella zeiphila]MBB6733278.1 metallophosphoesterase [Cohnella zeiphila]